MSVEGVIMGGLAAVAVVAVLYSTKPSVCFDKTSGEPLEFGLENGETLAPVWLASVAAGVLVYTIHAAI